MRAAPDGHAVVAPRLLVAASPPVALAPVPAKGHDTFFLVHRCEPCRRAALLEGLRYCRDQRALARPRVPRDEQLREAAFTHTRAAEPVMAEDERRSRQAPGAASRDMYLDSAGKPTEDSVTGYRASGVPGTVKGLEFAHRKYGKKAWADLLAPAA